MVDTSVAIQVLPEAADSEELIRIVDEVIAYIKSFQLKTVVGPFETVVEGDYDTLMKMVKGCNEIAIKAGAPSLISYVKIAYHPNGGLLGIEEKTKKHQ